MSQETVLTTEQQKLSVASKWLTASMIAEEFDRAFNEVFEDLLIRRWQGPARVRKLGKAQVVEDKEPYRVKIVQPDVDPR
jgi:hypothetical protein